MLRGRFYESYIPLQSLGSFSSALIPSSLALWKSGTTFQTFRIETLLKSMKTQFKTQINVSHLHQYGKTSRILFLSFWSVVQKWGISQGHGNRRKMDFVVNESDFTINAAYVVVAVNSNIFTIQSWYLVFALCFVYVTFNFCVTRLLFDD